MLSVLDPVAASQNAVLDPVAASQDAVLADISPQAVARPCLLSP